MVYDKGASIWIDFRDQHEKEARHILDAMEAEFREKLPENFRPIYDTLNDRRKVAFRICRSLQYYGKGKLFLSARELQARMGLTNPSIAHELLIALKDKKVIRCIKRGTLTNGRASEYQWVLKPAKSSKIISFVEDCQNANENCPPYREITPFNKTIPPLPCHHVSSKPNVYLDYEVLLKDLLIA